MLVEIIVDLQQSSLLFSNILMFCTPSPLSKDVTPLWTESRMSLNISHEPKNCSVHNFFWSVTFWYTELQIRGLNSFEKNPYNFREKNRTIRTFFLKKSNFFWKSVQSVQFLKKIPTIRTYDILNWVCKNHILNWVCYTII